MKIQGRREVAENILTGVAVYVVSELAAWGLTTLKQRAERRRRAAKKRRKAKKRP